MPKGGGQRELRPTGRARLLPSRDSSAFNPWLGRLFCLPKHGIARIHFTPALAAAAGSICLRAEAAPMRTPSSLSDRISKSIGTAALALVPNRPMALNTELRSIG